MSGMCTIQVQAKQQQRISLMSNYSSYVPDNLASTSTYTQDWWIHPILTWTLFSPQSLPVLVLFSPQSLPVLVLFSPQSLPVLVLFSPQSLPVLVLFSPQSLPVLVLFSPQSLPVLVLFSPQSLPVLVLFSPQSLPVLVLHLLLDVHEHVRRDVTLQVLRQMLRRVLQVLLVLLRNVTWHTGQFKGYKRMLQHDAIWPFPATKIPWLWFAQNFFQTGWFWWNLCIQQLTLRHAPDAWQIDIFNSMFTQFPAPSL